MELETGGPGLPATPYYRAQRRAIPRRIPHRPLAAGASILAITSVIAAAVHGFAFGGGHGGATPSSSLKPVLVGLLDRQGAPRSRFDHVLGGYVVNVTWAQLQPSPGAAIARGNPIDQAIAQVRADNARNHTRWGLRLRMFAGVSAPAWAKSLGGAPVELVDPQGGQRGSVGRFWTPQFGAAYAQLERELAARYDSVPELRDVVISRCTTFYAEPLMRDIAVGSNVRALLAAGYSVAADHSCQSQAIAAHAVWRHTRSTLAFNPYQEVLPGGRVGIDETYTEQLMGVCRATLGARCVLENNSLRVDTPAGYARMYRAMLRYGAPITFQTATMSHIGSLMGTLAIARRLGAAAVELPAQFEHSPPSAFAGISQGLAANVQRA